MLQFLTVLGSSEKLRLNPIKTDALKFYRFIPLDLKGSNPIGK